MDKLLIVIAAAALLAGVPASAQNHSNQPESAQRASGPQITPDTGRLQNDVHGRPDPGMPRPRHRRDTKGGGGANTSDSHTPNK